MASDLEISEKRAIVAMRTARDLRVALERIAQAAEQYLDAGHCSPEREAELRRNLAEAATDAALLLYPSVDHSESHTGVGGNP